MHETADAIVTCLFAGGWNADALCETPPEVLSDWLRDREHEEWADFVLENWCHWVYMRLLAARTVRRRYSLFLGRIVS